MRQSALGWWGMFRSYRTKLQFAFVALGLALIAATGWIASASATAALQQASYDRLTAVRETRAQELERYYDNLSSQVQALAADDSILSALEQFRAAWPSIPLPRDGGATVAAYYRDVHAPESWIPVDPRTQAVQQAWIAGNPHPEGAKDLLLDSPTLGRYGEIHARYHPTFHRYKTAFGFYDLFLIEPEDGRILYTVMKEIDVGAALTSEPYRSTPLAEIFRKVILAGPDGGVILQDYEPYAPSGMAPAAFMAVPMLRAGKIDGVLAIQVAIDEVNDVMDGGRRWREQGLGETGQVFAVGPDNTLRSDLRESIEDPEAYLKGLRAAGIPEDVVGRIQRQQTSVLTYPVDLGVAERVREGERRTEIGRNTSGVAVLRSHAPLKIAGLDWAIIAEIEEREALQAVSALNRRIWMLAMGVAVLFFLAARWLAVSVTGPVLTVAAGVRHVGKGVRGLRIANDSSDEIGQLAADFNRMIEDLERTTVSRDDYQALSGRLITAQEDERRRIARELHDDFTQRLAAAAIEIGRLEREQTSAAAREKLAELKLRMAKISDDVHGLSRHLHPRMLDDLGLAAAMEAECRASFERGGPIVNVEIAGDFQSVPRDTQLTLYRITQESLRNIQKHANVEEADVRLLRGAKSIDLIIQDRGEGFDRSSSDWKPGLGLASMEERVRLLGGDLTVKSEKGRGTRIHVVLPLREEA